jgi:hypothetical protein
MVLTAQKVAPGFCYLFGVPQLNLRGSLKRPSARASVPLLQRTVLWYAGQRTVIDPFIWPSMPSTHLPLYDNVLQVVESLLRLLRCASAATMMSPKTLALT